MPLVVSEACERAAVAALLMGFLTLADVPRHWIAGARELSIYDAAVAVAARGVEPNPFVVRDQLGGDARIVGQSPIEWSEYCDECLPASRLPGVLQELAHVAARRSALAAAEALTRAATAETALPEALAEAQEHLQAAQPAAPRKLRTLVDYADDLDATLRPGEAARVPSPWPALDAVSAGIGRAEFVVLGALPGYGKSAAAQQWGEHAANLGYPVLFLSYEMPAWMLAMRRVARVSDLTIGQLIRGGESVANRAAVTLRRHPVPLCHMEDGISAFADGEALVSAWAKTLPKDRPGLVIIDHLQHIAAEADSIAEDAKRIVEGCTRIAKKYGVGVLGIGQFAKDKEIGRKREPLASDLWGGAPIWHHATTIMLLHEPCENEGPGPRQMQLRLAKARNGQPGTRVDLLFDGAHANFTQMKVPNVF